MLRTLTKRPFVLKAIKQQSTYATTALAQKKPKKRLVFDNRSPSFQDFLAQQTSNNTIDPKLTQPDNVPYLDIDSQLLGKGKKFFIEVYGCQVLHFDNRGRQKKFKYKIMYR